MKKQKPYIPTWHRPEFIKRQDEIINLKIVVESEMHKKAGGDSMTDKEIEDIRSKMDELIFWLKVTEDENLRLKKTVKNCREKIELLQKEQEEKGNQITISDGMITLKADMLEAFNENKTLKAENSVLKQKIKDIENGLHVMVDTIMDKNQ